MTTLNFVANVFQAGTSATGLSGDLAFTTGRHILAIIYAQRNAHENGLGSGQWSITDDATTNSPTWTERGLSSIFTVDANEIQIAVYTSDALTATETFELTADASTGADTFRYRFTIYEIIDGDGTIAELVYDDHTGSADDWVLNFGSAPSSGDAQVIAGSTFGGGAANYDAAPTNFTEDGSGDQVVAHSSTTDTTQNVSYGKGGTQDAVAVRAKLVAAAADTDADAEAATSTGVGVDPAASIAPGAAEATATGAGGDAGPSVAPTGGEAGATGAGIDAATSIATGAVEATATGTGGDAAASVAPNTETATATGTGVDATVSTAAGTNAPAETATATGAGGDASSSIAPGAVEATATGVGQDSAAAVAPSAETGTATGTGVDGSASIAPAAETAPGTGTALDATAESPTAPAETAPGTGAGHDATTTATGEAGGGISFQQLMALIRAGGDDHQRVRANPVTCPNDATTLETGHDGELFCPYDGWRPSDHVGVGGWT